MTLHKQASLHLGWTRWTVATDPRATASAGETKRRLHLLHGPKRDSPQPDFRPSAWWKPSRHAGRLGAALRGGVHGGSHYQCRFGASLVQHQYVPAVVSYVCRRGLLVAPPGNPAVALPVALALNGQQFHLAPVHMRGLGRPLLPVTSLRQRQGPFVAAPRDHLAQPGRWRRPRRGR